MLNSVVGMVGLVPTLTAIEKGTDIALANKETLVAGGELVIKAAAEKGVERSILLTANIRLSFSACRETRATSSKG